MTKRADGRSTNKIDHDGLEVEDIVYGRAYVPTKSIAPRYNPTKFTVAGNKTFDAAEIIIQCEVTIVRHSVERYLGRVQLNIGSGELSLCNLQFSIGRSYYGLGGIQIGTDIG